MNMDHPANVDLLIQIGDEAAKDYVKAQHLPKPFDLREAQEKLQKFEQPRRGVVAHRLNRPSRFFAYRVRRTVRLKYYSLILASQT